MNKAWKTFVSKTTFVDNAQNKGQTSEDCCESCREQNGCSTKIPCQDNEDCKSEVCTSNICEDAWG